MNYTNDLYKQFKKLKNKLKKTLESKPGDLFPLIPELPLPEGVSEAELRNFSKSVLVSDAPPQEMEIYCEQDFRRFVYTYGLVRDLSEKCLELGANPYFTTMLPRQFTRLELSLANYFGSPCVDQVVQEVTYKNFRVLKPDRVLVLTTPNVNRLQNVSKRISGNAYSL